MSAAVHRTDLSWPAIAAYELGLTAEQFTFPTYEWPTGPGGLPLDLERLARSFEKRFGAHLDFWEIVTAGLWLQSYMDRIEDYWERGDGSKTPLGGAPFHNTAVYGWDLLDPQLLTSTKVAARLGRPTKDDALSQLVEHHQDRAAWPVLQHARKGNRGRTVLDAVTEMSGPGQGVETLVVVLGSNNALGAVVSLEPAWTPEGYADLPLEERLAARVGCNLWRPSAFAADWSSLEAKLRGVAAQHVIIATVPSVTIAPIARGTFKKVRPQSRYFPYYTRPWITDDDFDTKRDPHITGDEARAIDSAIDAYNETMIDSVAAARRDGLDWYLFDMGVAPRPARDPALHRQSVGPAGLVDAVRAAPRAARAGPGAEHPVLPVRARWAHRRRPVLPRRRAPDDDRLRHPRPGGHQGDGAGRRRVRRPPRPAPRRPGAGRLRTAAAGRHPDRLPARLDQQHPQPARLARRPARPGQQVPAVRALAALATPWLPCAARRSTVLMPGLWSARVNSTNSASSSMWALWPGRT